MVTVVSDNPVKKVRITCPKCWYALEYTGEDIKQAKINPVRTSDMPNKPCFYITCPRESCLTKINVDKD